MRKWVWLVVLAGCVDSSSVTCSDGSVCPAQTRCDTANHACVLPEQLETCVGIADGTDCAISGQPVGICSKQVCIQGRCGDGFIRGSERCDSTDLAGKTTCLDLGYYNSASLTCTADCVYDTAVCKDYCGDGIVNGPEFCEPGQIAAHVSCLDYGFDAGNIACSGACQPSFDGCEHYGFTPIVTGSGAFLNAVWGSSATDVFVVGEGIVHWDGSAWAKQSPNTPNALDAVWGTGPDNVWAVGENGTIDHYTGGTWTATTPVADWLHGVWGSGPNDVFAVGGNGRIEHWNGSAWSQMTSTVSVTLESVWGSAPNDVYAVGGDRVAHYDGSNWTNTALNGNLHSVWGTAANDVWIAADGSGAGRYFHRISSWSVFQPIAWSTRADVVWGPGAGQLYIGTDAGVALGDGAKFLKMPAAELVSLWGAAADDVWGVTSFGGLRHFDGTAWIDDQNAVATPMYEATGTDASNAFVGGATTVQRWDGFTWSSLSPAPTVSLVLGVWVAAAQDVFVTGTGGAIVRFTGSGWTTMTSMTGEDLAGIWGRTASDVFAVGANGAIVHYNGAGSWTPMTSNTTATLLTAWGSSATDVYAAGLGPAPTYGSIILHYNGSSWSTVESGTAGIVYSLWGSGPNDIFGATVGGVLHWDGTAWTLMDAGTPNALFAVSGTGPSDVFATGSIGTIVHYNGTAWEPIRSNTEKVISTVYAAPTRVVFGGDDGTLVLVR